MTSRLDAGVRNSVADETEIIWIEHRRSRVAIGLEAAEAYRVRERTVQVRVVERGRVGCYRTGDTQLGEMDHAVRMALGHARVAPRTQPPPLPGEEQSLPKRRPMHDRALARLDPEGARRWLRGQCEDQDAAILEWTEGQVVVCNSRGLRRWSRATTVYLQVRSGQGAGAGLATDAARTLDRLGAPGVFARARRRRTGSEVGQGLPTTGALVLAPEATAELVALLNHCSLGAHAYREGGSFLREHTGVQVFDQRLTLRDDGTDASGLPFGYDLEGRSKRAILLVEAGVPRTPALDTWSAAEFGLEPTAHAVGAGEALALNLFLEPGDSSEEQLLRAAGDGVWISRLEGVECYDPLRVLVRARARGVRRIAGGEITHPLPPLIWEDSLLRVFSHLGAVGRTTARRPSSDGLLGGISAPAMLVADAPGLRPGG
ncbi:MAG TPA: metallopeptidase TldD-related protein [Thermoanaerobaculia bacterium]|nr:metallopeptidase TldD-related protein [Thermoanaerobaculia bacterium]